jgi:hypothetical protein
VQLSNLVEAFPGALAEDVRGVLALVPGAELDPVEPFSVVVPGGGAVAIPTRIYYPEPASALGLSPTQRTILHCLYTRHHDGWVRQRHLEQIITSAEPWVAPFVVQLAGEYVLEIVQLILRAAPHPLYGEFIVRNPAFFARTERRVVSYWTCYYRRQYPDFGSYPGGLLVDAFRSAASAHAGVRWPRHTPPPSAA